MSGDEKKQGEGHSQTGNSRGTDLSGHGKIRPSRGTHPLETVEGGACQDMERIRQNGGTHVLETAEGGLVKMRKETDRGHLPTGDGRGRDLSGRGKKLTERGALTN